MQPICNTAAIRQLEHAFASANPGVSLMERAGLAAAEHARTLLGDGYRVLVVCGPGNNGGDGFVVARHLRTWGYRVHVTLSGDAAKLPPDASTAYQALIANGGTIATSLPQTGAFDLIIDALFGIGLARPIDGHFADVVDKVNVSNKPVLALDIPSGIDSDTGNILGTAVRATETITFIGLKPGLVTADARDCCGRVVTAQLGIDPGTIVARGRLLDQGAIAAHIPKRLANSHKGSYGNVGILGGSEGMQGAVALAARAALKLGAGRVYVGTVAKFASGYDPNQPEVMWRSADDLLALSHLTTLVAGPGLGQAAGARVLLAKAVDARASLLLDADALNIVAGHEPLQAALAARHAPTLLTPHPAEAARLLERDTRTVQGDRVGSALELADRFRAAVVLKGTGSICALADGRWYANPTGNPGMATAGMGDVLSGMIAALLAQGLEAEPAMQLGVYLHGAAADSLVERGVGPLGLVAGEVIDEARRLINTWAPHHQR